MSMPPSGSEFSPLEYAAAAPRRPGILTAVGVLSIIVGAMSVLGSLGSVGSGIMYLTMGAMHARRAGGGCGVDDDDAGVGWYGGGYF